MTARRSKKQERKAERKQRKKEKKRENKNLTHAIEAKRWNRGVNDPGWRNGWFIFRTYKTAAKRDAALREILRRKKDGDRIFRNFDFRECSLKKKKDGGETVSTG
tara:strand:+ start:147 stop:461 length:315 start_codon:yes stop_codon:yes gene_type:complete